MTRTVLVTGASGFIAKHIVKQLLERGDHVRASLRSLKREAEVRAAVHGERPDLAGSLSFVTLDLTSDKGWAEAMAGVDALIHTASPFPLVQPKDENELIRPAVDGTLRALKAAKAAGVHRVVMTSSIASIAGGAPVSGRAFDERDWTDVTIPGMTAYTKSKTLAERAAWDYVAGEGAGLKLTAINPAFVLGTPLDQHYGSSVGLVGRMLKGKDPMVPNMGFAIVDVEDVARAHVMALDAEASIGQRIIAASDPLWFAEMGQVLKQAYPTRRIATRVAPKLLLWFLALFDPSIRSVLPSLGRNDRFSTERAKTVLGMSFVPAKEALLNSARFLTESGV
jgi:dihydroflavonol-4-reductase